MVEERATSVSKPPQPALTGDVAPVRAFWEQLGLPGLIDVHVHFLPPNIQRAVYAVFDAGRIINPQLAHSHALGGLIQGIGMTLLEHGVSDHRDGRLVTSLTRDDFEIRDEGRPQPIVLFSNDPLAGSRPGEVSSQGEFPA